MTTIPALVDGNGIQYPATPFPTDMIAVVCDGMTYTVYEPGDTVPSQDQ